jgi:hypothetical protein
MAQYDFASFPSPPVWIRPVIAPIVAGHATVRSSGVELSDGRVLHVWEENKGSSPRSGYVHLGYCSDVETYLTVDDSVTFDRTLVTNTDNSSGSSGTGFGVWTAICRGPDGAIWLHHACFGGDNTGDWTAVVSYDASMDAPPSPYTTRSMLWRSVDEGATWQYVTHFPQSIGLTSRNIGGNGSSMIGGIEVVPSGFPHAGRWLTTAASAHNYFGAPVWSGAIYASDNAGATWTRVLPVVTSGSNGNYVSAGSYGFASNGCIYLRSHGNIGIVGQLNRWHQSCDGGDTWTLTQPSYSTPSVPNENVGNGPMLTVDSPRTLGSFVRTAAATSLPFRLRINDMVAEPTPHWDEAGVLVPPDTYTMLYNSGATGGDGGFLQKLSDRWAGYWSGGRVLGFALRPPSTCPTPPKLHIPHPNWYRYPPPRAHRYQIENWRALQTWADKLMRLGGTTKKLHVHVPVGQPVDEQGHARAAKQVTDANYRNYRRLEQWADSLCHTHPLHIPHKRLPEARIGPAHSLTVEQQNWQAIQRWADQLRA